MLSKFRNLSHFTHVGTGGQAVMVDIGSKPSTVRTAFARGKVRVGPEAFRLVSENLIKKGDVLSVARIAGIQGAKKTSELIPLCHQLPLSSVNIDFDLLEKDWSVLVTSRVSTYYKTGVEMEAITAVMIACANIYDMCKAVNKSIVISDIELTSKTGGQNGDYNS